MSFENPIQGGRAAFREHHSPEYLHPIIEKAAAKARETFKRDGIDPLAFTPPYDTADVLRDIAKAHDLERKFNAEERVHKLYADAFEGVIYENIELQDWLGRSARTIKTSQYDDYVNGVDLMVEFEHDDRFVSHLGLGVDVTFGTASMEKKFARIREEIAAGKLGTVKYFASEQSPHKGMYQNLPRVIVGVERDHVVELAARWMDPRLRAGLKDHPVQAILIDEIAAELEYFRRYALRTGQTQLVPIYDRSLSLVRRIQAEKRHYRDNDWSDDRVLKSIRQELGRFA
jgi:hypothetical protein